jgi:hypothetical protein
MEKKVEGKRHLLIGKGETLCGGSLKGGAGSWTNNYITCPECKEILNRSIVHFYVNGGSLCGFESDFMRASVDQRDVTCPDCLEILNLKKPDTLHEISETLERIEKKLDEKKPVVMAEGEKTAESMRKSGFFAICTSDLEKNKRLKKAAEEYTKDVLSQAAETLARFNASIFCDVQPAKPKTRYDWSKAPDWAQWGFEDKNGGQCWGSNLNDFEKLIERTNMNPLTLERRPK